MPSAHSAVISRGNLTAEERQAVERVLRSRTFATAPRLRSVLQYLLEELERGTVDGVTEQTIGHAVFGRPAGYNAGEDNIVRVTVRHLRTRLEEFYRTEAADDAMLLEIPKGKYIPQFAQRSAAAKEPVLPLSAVLPAPAVPAAPAVLPVPKVAAAESAEARQARALPRRAMWLALLCTAVLAGVLGYGVRVLQARAAATPQSGILGALCPPQHDVLVVVADSNLQVYRAVFGKQVTLDAYVDRRYAQEPLDTADERVRAARRFALGASETNVSSTIVAASVLRDLVPRHVAIKQPHEVSMREFQTAQDIVLLGGPWINPWGQLFENRLTFRLLPMADSPASSEVHNFDPKPGEALDLLPHAEGNLTVNYARVAILPNFEKNGRVFLLGATSPEALEAAGQFLLTENARAALLETFDLKRVEDLPPAELVLEVKGLQYVPGSWRIVAHRLVTR